MIGQLCEVAILPRYFGRSWKTIISRKLGTWCLTNRFPSLLQKRYTIKINLTRGLYRIFIIYTYGNEHSYLTCVNLAAQSGWGIPEWHILKHSRQICSRFICRVFLIFNDVFLYCINFIILGWWILVEGKWLALITQFEDKKVTGVPNILQ